MIPNDFNIKVTGRATSFSNAKRGDLIAEYDANALVLKMDDARQTTVEKNVYVVERKLPDLGCSSGQKVDVRPLDVVGTSVSHHGFCASWFWPLKHLTGDKAPEEMYSQFWKTPYNLDDLLVVKAWPDGPSPKGYPPSGAVVRARGITRSGMMATVRVRDIMTGAEFDGVGAGALWPLSALGTACVEVAKRDPRFPHDCPKCKKPAYIGAYGAECSARCGIWTKM